MKRETFLADLSGTIAALEHQTPLCVAITGIGTSGKTTLADELTVRLRARDLTVLRASIDDVYLPGRFRPGASKPLHVQFVEDNVLDLPLFRCTLLDPCLPGGSRSIRRPTPHLAANRIELGEPERVAEQTIVLVDGVFLLHPSLRDVWAFAVWLGVDPDFCRRHGAERGQANDIDCARRLARDHEGDTQAVIRWLYEKIFIPGHQLFVDRYQPARCADWVVDHRDPQRPVVTGRRRPGYRDDNNQG